MLSSIRFTLSNARIYRRLSDGRKGNLIDFVAASLKHGFSYWEYADKYLIYKCRRSERNQFISFRRANYIYEKLNNSSDKKLFDNTSVS